MNPVNRVTKIGVTDPIGKWQRDDFLLAAKRAKDLWQSTEELFEIQYGMLRDAVAEIDPTFELSDTDATAIQSANIPQLYLLKRIAVSFVKWETCPATSGFPNPYEPLLEIWEHGGDINKEHGQFIDIFDQSGVPVGGMFVRLA